ncbi:LysR family transcriptional regulator [Mycobacterium simiae]|uniref:LysR family transcriptional regulator n=1 Tax=Mycobacterium simiae TaxID=1784 RepID=UPI000414E736|nr:LysR family transcriptional regulator [Mycobacterium simiae]PLV49918.1 LysR family transcriptional regulator [Mycobacterium tuberculosis variant microti OV254]BBX39451.1 transcriptional regulator [Mycobacterium simiae]
MPLSPRVPEIGSLDLLLSVARLGSLAKAAREHGVSQPAAASRIRNMERLIGVPLIVRSTAGSRLTDHGAMIANWARRVVDAASDLDAGITALRGHQASRIRVACSMTIAEYLLPRWLSELRARVPTATIGLQVINSAKVAELVLGGAADVGFVEGAKVSDGLDSVVVAHDELVLVVGHTHPWAHRRAPVGAAELSRTALISREPGSGTRYVLEHELDHLGYPVTVDPMMELSSTTAIKSAVEAGIGAAVLSSLALADEIAQHRLIVVPTDGMDLRRSLRLVLRSGEQLPAMLRDVVGATRVIANSDTS